MSEDFESLREAAVAGAFYPADKDTLQQQIDEFLGNVPEQKIEGNLRILIVPHAGYSYSGPVAAHAFKQLQDKSYSRVVLIGGSHQARFSEAAVDESTHWQTPLGKVEVDLEFVQKLIGASPAISKNSEVHVAEHSLEVEIPFLQTVLGEFKIVPILLGDDSKELAQKVADVLGKIIDDSTLVVISTDLSHYPSYNDARIIDKKTISAILGGIITEFEKIITEQMSQGVPNLFTCVCGEGAVKVGMYLAEKLGEGEWRLLKYANSGDIAGGDRSRVVGYAAIGFLATTETQKKTENTEELSKRQQDRLLKIARETLEVYLAARRVPKFGVDDEKLSQHLGAFVTLRKNGQLRGCIGEFEADKPLWQVVRQKVVDSAVHDPRFLPLTADELDEIKIEISVLSPKQKIRDSSQIELGKHGVVIQKGEHSGVFLPQVAIETGWDLEEFLGQLCSQKAGLSWYCWQEKSIDLYTFTTQVFRE